MMMSFSQLHVANREYLIFFIFPSRFCCSASSCHWMTPFRLPIWLFPQRFKTWAISACHRSIQIGESTLWYNELLDWVGGRILIVFLSCDRLISFYKRMELNSCEAQLESRLRSGWSSFKPPPSLEDVQGVPFWCSQWAINEHIVRCSFGSSPSRSWQSIQ